MSITAEPGSPLPRLLVGLSVWALAGCGPGAEAYLTQDGEPMGYYAGQAGNPLGGSGFYGGNPYYYYGMPYVGPYGYGVGGGYMSAGSASGGYWGGPW
ncbi:hypothetical protein [Methylococcus capsulatus]|jgi:hypothetical protein|uniref:hypothetical protein n=1 Tax=Methylococcus capsulatus TaxID=414 RepID=UPI001C527EC1|nr:hypothetical protein [Methylococcus capsulatus]QXP90891.1 hypothetical protein KW114_01620 [Methylococcus capsulatus]